MATKDDVIKNTDGLSVYSVLSTSGTVSNLTRDCLLHCYLNNPNDTSIVSFTLKLETVQ